MTSLNENSARDLLFDLLLLFSFNIISNSYQSAYRDGQSTQQTVPPVHSVTLLESAIVDNNLDEVFDQTWAPTHNSRLLICLITDCATRNDLSHKRK